MRVLHWCMLGVTILLLVCEVILSQLCHSLIILVDGFHTLFILARMALTPPRTGSTTEPPPLPVGSSIEPLPGPAADGSDLPNPPPSPPALSCGLSFTSCRFQIVGAFISAVLLASLCLSYIVEIVFFTLEPKTVERPLLLVGVGAVSLLHKMLLLWLNWDHQETEQDKSHLEVNHRVLAAEEPTGQADPGQILYDTGLSAADQSLPNGDLVLCNPGTSSIPDVDSQTQEPQTVQLQAEALQDGRDRDAVSDVVDLSNSRDVTEISRDNTCLPHLGSQNACNASSVCRPSRGIERPVTSSRWFVHLSSFPDVIQSLCTSLLALINCLVMLLMGPQCLHSSRTCRLLVYLDPGLSLLAVVMLIASATPKVHRYGMLLLQATPPHICVSDLGRRIVSVPGVQAVHELHIWQLTESLTVASVHVHCHAGFPAHRCADLLSGVTKVLQSVGVSCCTVQPEFTSSSDSSSGCGCDATPVLHREDPSLSPPLACSLACGEACTGSLCCSPTEESSTQLAPSAGETKEEPQALVIENTFL